MNARIKELRLILGLSQEEFGAKLGVTNAAISRIESGTRRVTKHMLLSISRVFGTSYLWLTSGEGSMFENDNVVIDMNDRIKQFRLSLNLTQEEFGGRIGITKASVSKIENGVNGTTEQTLRSMCREFGASYLWLTTGEGPMFEPGSDDAALHVMVDRIMASENERVKQIFKNLGDFTEDDWSQLNALLDKLLAGTRPWEDEKED